MSGTINALVKDVLQAIKHPKTQEFVFKNMDEVNINLDEGNLLITLKALRSEFMLYNAIMNDYKHKFEALPGIKHVQFKIETIKNTKTQFSNIKNIIIIASGKGGVGKSTIAANLAVELAKTYKVGLLDADIYGPSITRLMGISSKPTLNSLGHFIPLEAHKVKFISSQCFIDDSPSGAFIWRGPMLVKMLYSMLCNTIWEQLDYLIIDTPPGTGDIHLSLCENFFINGAILCTTPQVLATDNVKKAANMFLQMQTPIIGIVENMSYFEDAQNNQLQIFGNSKVSLLAKELTTTILTKLPFLPEVVEKSDQGKPIVLSNMVFANLFYNIIKKL